MGLGALSKQDCVYPTAFVDSNGVALDGSHSYVMHFDKGALPPSKMNVWSISPYRGNFYVRNSINRYGILSSMSLKYNPDGSLDIFMQKDSPAADQEANWLPIPPSGMFNLTVRSYQPGEALLDGPYKLPPVVEGAMRRQLMIAAFAEAAIGVIVLAYPPIVVHLLVASEITGAGIIMSRIARCFPDRTGRCLLAGR